MHFFAIKKKSVSHFLSLKGALSTMQNTYHVKTPVMHTLVLQKTNKRVYI